MNGFFGFPGFSKNGDIVDKIRHKVDNIVRGSLYYGHRLTVSFSIITSLKLSKEEANHIQFGKQF